MPFFPPPPPPIIVPLVLQAPSTPGQARAQLLGFAIGGIIGGAVALYAYFTWPLKPRPDGVLWIAVGAFLFGAGAVAAFLMAGAE